MLLNKVSILKNTFQPDHSISVEKAFEHQVDLRNDKAMIEARNAVSSYWINPYLSI
jgi:hypothetical protein